MSAVDELFRDHTGLEDDAEGTRAADATDEEETEAGPEEAPSGRGFGDPLYSGPIAQLSVSPGSSLVPRQ